MNAKEMIKVILQTEKEYYAILNEYTKEFGVNDPDTNRARSRWMGIVNLIETLKIENND